MKVTGSAGIGLVIILLNNRTFLNSPLATSGNMSSGQLAQRQVF